jgi:hypothetical protein
MLLRLAISAGAAIGAAVGAALMVTVIDLYVTGHGYGSITSEVITMAQAGVHLSIGDLAMLITAVVAGVATWFLVGHESYNNT